MFRVEVHREISRTGVERKAIVAPEGVSPAASVSPVRASKTTASGASAIAPTHAREVTATTPRHRMSVAPRGRARQRTIGRHAAVITPIGPAAAALPIRVRIRRSAASDRVQTPMTTPAPTHRVAERREGPKIGAPGTPMTTTMSRSREVEPRVEAHRIAMHPIATHPIDASEPLDEGPAPMTAVPISPVERRTPSVTVAEKRAKMTDRVAPRDEIGPVATRVMTIGQAAATAAAERRDPTATTMMTAVPISPVERRTPSMTAAEKKAKTSDRAARRAETAPAATRVTKVMATDRAALIVHADEVETTLTAMTAMTE